MPVNFSSVLPKASLQSFARLAPHEDPFVDGLRGLSVLMVIWFHTLYAINFAFGPDYFQAYLSQYPAWLHFIFGSDKAVDIFFMISAFLLGSSLRRQANEKSLSVSRFYIHRIFRIYPLFLLALLVFGLAGGFGSVERLVVNLLFIDSIKTIVPVGWSLAVEMQCYLVLPLVIILAHRSNSPLLFLWFLLFVSMGARTYAALQQPESYQTPFINFLTKESDINLYMHPLYYSTLGRANSFIMGLIWAYTLGSPGVSRVVTAIQKNSALYHGSLLACFAVIYASMNFPVYVGASPYYQNFDAQLNLIAVVNHRWAFCMALLGIILLTQKHATLGLGHYFRKALTLTFWRPFSKMAFPIYLFHFPFVALGWLLVLRTTNLDGISHISVWQTILAAFFTTILVTWFSMPLHFKLELKGVQLGKKLANAPFLKRLSS